MAYLQFAIEDFVKCLTPRKVRSQAAWRYFSEPACKRYEVHTTPNLAGDLPSP